MNRVMTMSLAAGLTFICAVGSAFAGSGTMKLTGNASQPVGAYEFCQREPSDCHNAKGDEGPLALTQDLWKEILAVNYKTNAEITPVTDKELYGVEEFWTYPTTAGDCEDYALLKRKRLIEAGVSPSDLLMTVVLQPNGEGHAVLTVRTDHGDFVLDNMRDRVLLWSDTEYTFLKRQAAADPSRWVKIDDSRATMAVGSVR